MLKLIGVLLLSICISSNADETPSRFLGTFHVVNQDMMYEVANVTIFNDGTYHWDNRTCFDSVGAKGTWKAVGDELLLTSENHEGIWYNTIAAPASKVYLSYVSEDEINARVIADSIKKQKYFDEPQILKRGEFCPYCVSGKVRQPASLCANK